MLGKSVDDLYDLDNNLDKKFLEPSIDNLINCDVVFLHHQMV